MDKEQKPGELRFRQRISIRNKLCLKYRNSRTKNTTTEMKNSLQNLNGRFELAGGKEPANLKISQLFLIQSEEQLKSEQGLRHQ